MKPPVVLPNGCMGELPNASTAGLAEGSPESIKNADACTVCLLVIKLLTESLLLLGKHLCKSNAELDVTGVIIKECVPFPSATMYKAAEMFLETSKGPQCAGARGFSE